MASLVQSFKPVWPFLVGFAVSGYAFTKAYFSSYRNPDARAASGYLKARDGGGH